MKKRLKQKAAYPLMHLRQNEFGKASKLAKAVYRTLPRIKRKHGLYGKITGRAVKLLRQGLTAETTKQLLLEWLNGSDATISQNQVSNITNNHTNKEVKSLSCLAGKPIETLTTFTFPYQCGNLPTNTILNFEEYATAIAPYKQHYHSAVEELSEFKGSCVK